MKIAIFTDTYLPQVNGVAKTLGRLNDFLKSKDIPCLVFAPEVDGKKLEDPNVHTFLSHDFFLYPECKLSLPSYGRIKQILDEFQPTLIHVTTPFPIGFLGLKYALEQGIPAVASYHTNFPQYLEYYRLDFFKGLAWHILRWFHNQFQRNYCPSMETLRLLKKHGINNLEVWSRGVSMENFHPNKKKEEWRTKMGAKGNKLLLLYVGRLAPEKDVEVLLDALHLVNRQLGHLVHLALVGDGPSKEELMVNAPENVTFVGYLQGEDLAAAYASADLFVFSSVTETLGNVVLEAMASGLPVVAPKAGGIKDNLSNMENGIACRPKNAVSMARAIATLVEDSVLRKNLAHQAYRYAGTRSWEAVFNRLLESYSEVVDNYYNRKFIRKVSGGFWTLIRRDKSC